MGRLWGASLSSLPPSRVFTGDRASRASWLWLWPKSNIRSCTMKGGGGAPPRKGMIGPPRPPAPALSYGLAGVTIHHSEF